MKIIRRFFSALRVSPRTLLVKNRRGVTARPGVFIGRRVRISAAATASLLLGPDMWIGDHAGITAEGCACIRTGSRVSLNEYSHIVCSGRLTLGDDVSINDHTVIQVHGDAVIGKDTLIGAYVLITDSGHETGRIDVPMRLQGRKPPTPLCIGEDVWIGTKVTITRGVTIGRGAIIGANAVLTQDVGEYEIWGGIPARYLGVRPGAVPAPAF